MKILPVSIKQAKDSDSSFFIELYNIYLKTGTVRICNCDAVITFNDLQYYPVPIQRGNIKSTVDSKIDNMDLKIADADNEKIAALMEGFDFRGKKVEILRIQYPESLEDNSIVMPVFCGYLDAPSYSNGEFTCSIKANFPNNNTPTRVTQYICNNTFGDENCKLSKDTRTVNVDIPMSNPTTIVTDFVNNSDYYKNGLITIGYETKMIKSNDEFGYVYTYYPFQGELQGTATLRRNCDKTPEMCAKYGNRKNYGGFLSIPKEFRVGT